jgi:dinuclear metal center YbgI/SA1388 family protein
MSVRVADLVRAMEAIAPTRLAAAWDNVGLLIGDPSAEVGRALLTIDCTLPVIEEARRAGCEAIVSYHPPIFDALKRFVAGSPAYEAARAGIAVFSPHTALDVAEGGTNDVLGDAIGMTARAALRPIPPGASPCLPPSSSSSSDVWGFGRVGAVDASPARSLVERAKRALGVSQMLVAGPLDGEVTRAAVCAGSGGELVADAVAAGAQLFLTGEVRHHDALRAVAAGMVVACARHSTSERGALAVLRARLAERLPEVAFACSGEDRDPFEFA